MEKSLYKYSFILPVYNVEKYLNQCIDSLLAQGSKCEIVLVDDGSTDSSGAICNGYANSCDRVKVFHKKNAGPAVARNFGLSAATGEYVIFIDSDDYVDEKLIAEFEKGNYTADLIFYSIIKRFSDGREEPMAEGLTKENIHGKNMDDVRMFMSECSKFPASPCGKIIKRDFLIKNNILFKEGITGEDIDWTLHLVCKAESADVFEAGIYYYRITPGTRRAYGNIKSVKDQLEIIEDWAEKCKNNENCVLSFLAYQYGVMLPYYGAVTRQERSIYRQRIRSKKFLLSYGKTRKIFMIRTAVRLLGITGASKLLCKYVTRRDRVEG